MLEEPRDMTDEEFERLTINERKTLAGKALKMKREMFHPNLMLMHSIMLQSELRDISTKS